MDVFDIAGPIMVCHSGFHTAGAVTESAKELFKINKG